MAYKWGWNPIITYDRNGSQPSKWGKERTTKNGGLLKNRSWCRSLKGNIVAENVQ